MDLPNRTRYEKSIRAALAAIFAKWRRAIKAGGDIPWDEIREEITAALRRDLERLAMFAYLLWLGQQSDAGFKPPQDAAAAGVAFDGLIAASGQIRSGTSADDLAKSLGVERGALLQLVTAAVGAALFAAEQASRMANAVVQNVYDVYISWKAAIASGADSQKIASELERSVSDQRAENIAVTETTRAFETGKEAAVTEFEKKYSIEVRRIWNTKQDERVCPICEPLNQTERSFWSVPFPKGPPAHPFCRCFVSLKL